MEKRILHLLPARNVPFDGLRTQSPLLMHPAQSPISPFIFLNHHGPQVYPPQNSGLPFGPHPHRGIETVTFVLEGDIRHRDSNGFDSTIQAGGIQWMTAGKGIIHEEISSDNFRQTGGPLEILQLWINLPAKDKMIPSTYTGLQVEELPQIPVADGKGSLFLIAGSANQTEGPVKTVNNPFMSYVKLEPDATFKLPIPPGRTVFLYLVSGNILMDGRSVPAMTLIVPDKTGNLLQLKTNSPTILLLGHADPLEEPVVAAGPFVMNTEAEIRQAYLDYQSGNFG